MMHLLHRMLKVVELVHEKTAIHELLPSIAFDNDTQNVSFRWEYKNREALLETDDDCCVALQLRNTETDEVFQRDHNVPIPDLIVGFLEDA